jgi:hypothetical protein
VRVIEQEPGTLHLAYQGQVDPVLKWISQFTIARMTSPQTSLQEAFIQYYQKQPGPVTEAGRDVTAAGGDS